MKQKKYIFLIFLTLIWASIYTYIALVFGFSQYKEIQRQTHLYPDMILPAEVVRWSSVGYDNAYADFQWIELIQYIGSNIWWSGYLDFSHRMIDVITKVNPYFIKPYEWSLLLVPMRNSNKSLSEESKSYIDTAVKISTRGFENLCKSPKLQMLQKQNFDPKVFQDEKMRNFCSNTSMIAYYLGFQYSELGNMKQSRYYYTIAGLHDNAPTASQILAVLASPTHNQRKIAQKFLLMAISTPQIKENNVCIETSFSLFQELQKNPIFTKKWIANFEKKEKSLRPPEKKENGTQYCFSFFDRAAKQIYQAYVTEVAKSYPDAKTGKDLIKLWALEKIPQTQTQTGFLIHRTPNNWKYYK